MWPQPSTLLPWPSSTDLSVSRASCMLFLFSDASLSALLQRPASFWEASRLTCDLFYSGILSLSKPLSFAP